MPRFQSPPRRTQRADFPHCAPPFASRHRLWGLSCWGDFRPVASHSIGVKQPSSVVQPPPIPSFPAEALSFLSKSPETPGRFSLRLDVYSPPQVLQINGRLCHLVLAFPYVGDIANGRVPSLRGHSSASSLLRPQPTPSRLRPTSRFRRLYGLPVNRQGGADREGQCTGSIGVAKPRRASMASAASRHRSSRSRRPVTSTPIGNPVPSSRPAGTHAEGSPSRLAGTTGRISSMVAAV